MPGSATSLPLHTAGDFPVLTGLTACAVVAVPAISNTITEAKAIWVERTDMTSSARWLVQRDTILKARALFEEISMLDRHVRQPPSESAAASHENQRPGGRAGLPSGYLIVVGLRGSPSWTRTCGSSSRTQNP